MIKLNSAIDFSKFIINIYDNRNTFYNPILDKIKLNEVNSDSWFKLNFSEIKKEDKFDFNKIQKINFDKLDKIQHKSNKFQILPNPKQKRILLNWIKCYTKMYNQTIKFFKERRHNKLPLIINFRKIRDDYLRNIKNNIYIKSHINKHILDYAIKDACEMYKSAISNLKRGNIKHFRLRYIKHNKKIKYMKIEKNIFSKNGNGFCVSILGFMKTLSGKLINVNSDCILQYRENNKKFYLIEANPTIKENKYNREIIALDPGIKIFLAGYSSKGIYEYGNNLQNTIKKRLKKINKIESEIKNKNIKEKALNKRYYKIKNILNDMHWKTINHLTNNFGNIIIGNLSTKDISENKNTDKMTKRIGSIMKLYEFKQKLKYKCFLKNIKYKETNESYTTKVCSNCGHYNKDINRNRIFDCISCKNKIGRDINSAKNILLKSLN